MDLLFNIQLLKEAEHDVMNYSDRVIFICRSEDLGRHLGWIKTMKDNKTIEIEILKKRIIKNTDHYCLRKPITKRVHIR